MSSRKIRVFVVEDHPSTAKALKDFLRVAGFGVEAAMDMASALELAGKISFDVLLCDLNLPDGTGWDLLAKLRKRGPVRAIAFSAFDEPEHIARSEAAGFLQYFVKGNPPEDLLTAIKRAAATALPSVVTPAHRLKATGLSVPPSGSQVSGANSTSFATPAEKRLPARKSGTKSKEV